MAGAASPEQREIGFVYVGDPMCSWCWAFAPVVEAVDTRYDLPIRVVTGGLRTGAAAERMDAQARAFLARYWQQVAERTGQEFTTASLERDGWTYDTEPACRAVVTMRELAPHEPLRWMARLHRAFYVEGADVTDPAVTTGLVGGFDVDPARFAALLADPASLRLTRQDFEVAHSHGVTGFPTLLLRDGDRLTTVARGYTPWERLEPALTRWLGELTRDAECDPAAGW